MTDLFESVVSCGCAAKVPPLELKGMLGHQRTCNPNVIVGIDTLDDAGIFRLNDHTSLVQTVDFFPPVARDPKDFGRIAAANALSDVYAMGGVPKTALAVLCCPEDLLSKGIIAQIQKGALEKLEEAQCELLGGHSVIDPNLKFGFSITGLVDTSNYFDNARAKVGDFLVLTKPIGSGTTLIAAIAGIASKKLEKQVTQSMATLNRTASEIARKIEATTVTDITGFGLLGHSLQLAQASRVNVEIFASQVPLFDEVIEFARSGFLSAATYSNRKYLGSQVIFDPSISVPYQDILFDPQTSGGLLICCPKHHINDLTSLMTEKLTQPYAIIGRITKETGQPRIAVKAGKYDLS